MKIIHLASFNGNIGDCINHSGLYAELSNNQIHFDEIHQLEIREFYWRERYFDDNFVELVNQYDLLLIGGGNYFELWVPDSPTGTSISLSQNLLSKIHIPIAIYGLGVDIGQGIAGDNLSKFSRFLQVLEMRRDTFVSVRNDGSRKTLEGLLGKNDSIHHVPDGGFLLSVKNNAEKERKIGVNVALDMSEKRYADGVASFVENLRMNIQVFLREYRDYKIVFFPHIYSDLQLISELLSNMDDKIRRNNIEVFQYAPSFKFVTAYQNAYSACEMILATRFHANVLALRSKLATIGVNSYCQIANMYSELNIPGLMDLVNLADHGAILTQFEKRDELKQYQQQGINVHLQSLHGLNEFISFLKRS